MAKEIRVYMAMVDGDETLGGPGRGIVEADKAFIGGYDRRGHDDKTVVLGMVERGGDVITRVVPDRSASSVGPIIREFVKPGSRIATDTAKAFAHLPALGYRHATVNHMEREYVRASVHTNTIEAFWAIVKRTIAGTHIWVSPKHLPKYLGEIEFRWNLRKRPELMFPLLLSSFLRS